MTRSRKTLGHSRHEAVTSDFEWAVMQFHNAFERYCLQVANVAGLGALSFAELYVLIVVCLQDESQPVAQIARQMNEQSVNNVHYSLGKLATAGLVRKARDPRGGSKNFVYSGTEKGCQLVEQYGEIRHQVLTEQTEQIENVDESLKIVTKFLSMAASVYDEAGRVAATQIPFRTA